MAVAIRSLKRRRRTAQRGKPMTQSQRWGKVVVTMPVPQGQITTTETWSAPTQPEPTLEEAIVAADAEVSVEEYVAPKPKKKAKKV